MHTNSSPIHRFPLECLSVPGRCCALSLWQPLSQGPAPAALGRGYALISTKIVRLGDVPSTRCLLQWWRCIKRWGFP
jgi:hypothetical protein